MQALKMFCHQCELSAPNGCGSSGASQGTCGKDDTLSRLQDIMMIGVKGLSAYREHARELGVDTREIDDVISETLYFTLTNVNFAFDDHVAQLMRIGQVGVRAMDLLSEAHTQHLGVPTPVAVTHNKAEGKAILVTGHNLNMLKMLLESTQGRGVNIYTHSEMLPAHGYPELRRYPHLKGHIGKAWFDQTELFELWQGPIVVTTNCIVPPKKNCGYLGRLFTYKVVGVTGAIQIEDDDFEPMIAKALSLPNVDGFDTDAVLHTGHHYKSILGLAPQILQAVRAGKISRFFVIAGCDAPGPAGDYFRELAAGLSASTVILTSSCGKFRFNDIDFGLVPGTAIPRYLDLGQCNDSNGAVHIASALSQALNVPVNDLPVTIVLSWMEQKAVLILLALFSLGIENIHLGPRAPQFVNAEIVEFLQKQFGLQITSTASQDLQKFLSQAA